VLNFLDIIAQIVKNVNRFALDSTSKYQFFTIFIDVVQLVTFPFGVKCHLILYLNTFSRSIQKRRPYQTALKQTDRSSKKAAGYPY